EMFRHVQQAIAEGVSVGFFSGNAVCGRILLDPKVRGFERNGVFGPAGGMRDFESGIQEADRHGCGIGENGPKFAAHRSGSLSVFHVHYAPVQRTAANDVVFRTRAAAVPAQRIVTPLFRV
ncbi:MAG: hypothetical protein N2C14_03175, partial [Planctomycetales bacterium]